MYKKQLTMAISITIILSVVILPFAKGNDTISFDSTNSTETKVSQGGEDLVAYSISGVRNSIYYAFDFSNFLSSATPTFAVFYVKSGAAIPDACNVEAYYFNSVDWTQTDPTLSTTGATNFVNQADEQYAFTSTSFIQAIKQACLDKSQLTVCLRAQANAYGDSTVLFQPNATLSVTYSTTSNQNNQTVSPSVPELSSAFTIFLMLGVGCLVATIPIIKRFKKSRKKCRRQTKKETLS